MKNTKSNALRTVLAAGLLMMSMTTANALSVVITIENLAPANGNALTPFWIGFHDGSWDTYDMGQPAAAYLEALAEDGNQAPITAAFNGYAQATVAGPGGPLLPGDTATYTVELDPNNPTYFSFASMILPSNDAFIGNDDPTVYQIFDGSGSFTSVDFFLLGTSILDAGTEINDELPGNTAFFGQAAPNTGVTEGGVIGMHPGFLPAGSGGILDDPNFSNADFLRQFYPVAQIRISAVPVPGALVLMLSGLLGLVGFSRRKQ